MDETIWISKNCYAIFSDTFKREYFYNRSGFLGVEKVPEKVVDGDREGVHEEEEERVQCVRGRRLSMAEVALVASLTGIRGR